ncbi:MAG: zf-HC2 domain-containing protein [Gemmatimonadaceae bacterium]|nr:zf-HC2 domain-containing protein [Gemmatimonadaceae bacterium]
MMPCSDFRARHLAWLDASLDAPVAQRMRTHADSCPRCQRFDASVRLGLLLARHTQPLRFSSLARARLQSRLKAQPRAEPRPTGAAILPSYGSGDAQGVQGSIGVGGVRPGVRLPRCG